MHIPARLTVLTVTGLSSALIALGAENTGILLPDGREFVSWEKPLSFTRTYYVDNRNSDASDSNPGSQDRPFLTIGKAAQVLQPGERVVIHTGTYRERIVPARGGTGPEKMISYEAAPGAQVVVKGSRITKGWRPSSGFRWQLDPTVPDQPPPGKLPAIYQVPLEEMDFHGYNPFGMVNILHDRRAANYIGAPPQGLRPYLLRRGLVFMDGRRLDQVELYQEMVGKDGTYWCEHNGLTLHVRLTGDANPADHEMELVIQEQILAPRERYLGYIRLKGITFEHGANGFPVPQRGLVSTNRGHHWIIEDCTIRQANAVALDIGNETWNASGAPMVGHHIVRRNHISDAGVCGIAGARVVETIVESNTVEKVGWQDVAPMAESAGIKLHGARNCLVRNNVVRHLKYASGIWLDSANVNSRVFGNVVGDLLEARNGIFVEASRERNMIDHNIVWKMTMGQVGSFTTGTIRKDGARGVYAGRSDVTVIAHNLIGYCEEAGVKTRGIAGGRGGTGIGNEVLNNILYKNSKSIDFSNRDNRAEGNLYRKLAGPDQVASSTGGEGLGLNKAGTSDRLDLTAWQKDFGFDRTGSYSVLDINIDLDALTIEFVVPAAIPEIETAKPFQRDFKGESLGKTRHPGPFGRIPAGKSRINIDPRQ